MNERSKMISKLMRGRDTRESFVRSKLSVLLPAQIRSLRLRRGLTQAELGTEADMKQARISALERIGEASFSIATLIRIASAFRVGLIVRFAPMSEMLSWENAFQPDSFDVAPLEEDGAFIQPNAEANREPATPGIVYAMGGLTVPESLQTSGTRRVAPLGLIGRPSSTEPINEPQHDELSTLGANLGQANARNLSGLWESIAPQDQLPNGAAA